MTSNPERNITLDYYKIFLSILVITIHYKIMPNSPLEVFYNEILRDGIAKIAVPTFFIINGYFLKINDYNRVKKYIVRITILYITWSLFYLPNFDIGYIRLFLVNIIFGYYHLWYLLGLIGAVVLLFILKKYIHNNNLLLLIGLSLFIIGYIIQLNAGVTTFSEYKSRNFLFVGLPFLILGNIIRNADITLKNKTGYLLLAASVFLFVVEIYLSKLFMGNLWDTYLSLFIICPIALLFCINHSKYSSQKSDINHLSSAVYFIHVFVIKIASMLYVPSLYVFPFIVLFSVLLSFLIIYVNKFLRIFL